eukprot:TRINITY_DN17006_c0_g1_i1.p1 TRINITY_DN17006_c0_g1~~TRINITY_DN17006_c0_g1_i1.p1  ORF type:complete len:445 (-),score=125.44 TRINITY_DN17006_c0_g1_i1:269-1603(-)
MLWLSLLCFSLVRGQGEYEDPEEKPVEREAEFTSIPAKVMVNEGDTIRLPCFVDRIEGYVLLWKFGDTILSVGGRVIESSRGRRLLLEEETNGNFLVLKQTESSDGGDYMCQISAYRPKDIVHSVMVRTMPKVQVEKEVVTVTQGEGVSLKCNVKGGHPVPEISWRREGGSLPGGEEIIFSHTLKLSNLSSSSSGVYVCRGDNGYSADHTDSVQLVVEGTPVVEQSHLFIHSSQGGEVPVVCKVTSHPPATVLWYQGDQEEPLTSPQYNISHDKDTGTHTLLVHTQQPANTSLELQYKCVATNTMGSASKVVKISSRPGSPMVTATQLNQEDTWQLQWEVTSWPPVKSFTLELKGQDISRKVTVSAVKKSGDSTWSGEYSATGLAPGSRYQARVRAVSGDGEGPGSSWVQWDTLGPANSESRSEVTILLIMSALSALCFSTRTC